MPFIFLRCPGTVSITLLHVGGRASFSVVGIPASFSATFSMCDKPRPRREVIGIVRSWTPVIAGFGPEDGGSFRTAKPRDSGPGGAHVGDAGSQGR